MSQLESPYFQLRHIRNKSSVQDNLSQHQPKMIRIALFQPDIPQNTGTLLRLGACLDIAVDIIGPAGFTLSDKALRRSGMDYLDQAQMNIHVSWEAFCQSQPVSEGRLVLLTTKSERSYLDFDYRDNDILLLGRESSGVPDTVHESVEARVTIPMRPDARSLNMAISASMVAGEALRQTREPQATSTI